MSNAYDFKAWLETKNPDQTYRFIDCDGGCLMGQYMASKGEEWSVPRYSEYVIDVLGGRGTVLATEPETFGGALDRVRKMLEDA